MTQFMAFRLPYGALPSELAEYASTVEQGKGHTFKSLERKNTLELGQWWILRTPNGEWADIWCGEASEQLHKGCDLLEDTKIGLVFQTLLEDVQELLLWYAGDDGEDVECFSHLEGFIDSVKEQLLLSTHEVWAQLIPCRANTSM